MPKVTIQVKDRAEGEHIKRGLLVPSVRALAIISGVLSDFTPRAQQLILDQVADMLADPIHHDVAGNGKDQDVNPQPPTFPAS